MKTEEIIIGWVLGIISGPLVVLITHFFKNLMIEKSIKLELIDTRFNLSIAVMRVGQHVGKFDLAFVSWFRSELVFYRKYFPHSETLISFEEIVKKLEANPSLIKTMSASRSDSLMISKFSVPYLDQNLASLMFFSENKKLNLLSTKRYLEMLNSKIEQMDKWDTMTFDPSMAGNYSKLIENSDVCLMAIFNSAQSAITEINNYIIATENFE